MKLETRLFDVLCSRFIISFCIIYRGRRTDIKHINNGTQTYHLRVIKNKSGHGDCSSFPHLNYILIINNGIYYAQCPYNKSIVSSLFERFIYKYYYGNWAFPCTIFNTSLSKISMEFDCDITSCHRYLYNSHLMFYCYCGLSANSFE